MIEVFGQHYLVSAKPFVCRPVSEAAASSEVRDGRYVFTGGAALPPCEAREMSGCTVMWNFDPAIVYRIEPGAAPVFVGGEGGLRVETAKTVLRTSRGSAHSAASWLVGDNDLLATFAALQSAAVPAS